MNDAFNDGATPDIVAALLEQSPVVAVVGFQRCGKSTFAEALAAVLRERGRHVLMQCASAWVRSSAGDLHAASERTSVDPEIVAALDELERDDDAACWIVDDAEVMLADATDRMLSRLGTVIREARLSLVLIRNRFVLEQTGWLHQRQMLIAAHWPTVQMRPMAAEEALRISTELFHGEPRAYQATWLASFSGGIAGLVAELYPYAPESPSPNPDTRLLRLVHRKRAELKLDAPGRRHEILRVATAGALPPTALLSDSARLDVGALILSGMLSPDYFGRTDPFHGAFWRLVANVNREGIRIPTRLESVGLNLALMLADANLLDEVCHEAGLDGDETELARAFAAVLYCEDEYPALVRGLEGFLEQTMGRYGLLCVLRSSRMSPQSQSSSRHLTQMLLQLATVQH